MDIAVVVSKCRERAARLTQPGSERERLVTEFLEVLEDALDGEANEDGMAYFTSAELQALAVVINGRKESERWRQRQVG